MSGVCPLLKSTALPHMKGRVNCQINAFKKGMNNYYTIIKERSAAAQWGK
jgi:hypothetical protein